MAFTAGSNLCNDERIAMSLLYIEVIVMVMTAFLAGLILTWSFTGRKTN
jgi:hypothetical protein